MKTIFFVLFLTILSVAPAKALSTFDLTFNFGPSAFQSGNIQDLGSPNFNTGFGFNYFFRPEHGVGFAFNNEFDFEGSSKLPILDNASISTFDFHYAFRKEAGKFQLVFEPGLGWQTLYDKSSDYYWGYYYYDDISTAFILNYKLFARYNITEWEGGDMTSSGSFFIGAGIMQTFSFSDTYKGKDIDGSRFAAMFQLGVGW
jgi:hypothetical protein